MQKINVLSVFTRHFRTLSNEDGSLSLVDIIVFVVIPVAVGIILYWLGWEASQDALGLSVTVFSVFAALLLSVQVALYSVSLRPFERPEDPKKSAAYQERFDDRKSLLRELNDNIAYLILMSVILITVMLIAYVMDEHRVAASAIVTALYVHFFLTLLMVIKRASIVFSREYEA